MTQRGNSNDINSSQPQTNNLIQNNVKKNNIVSNNNSVIRKKLNNPSNLPTTSQTPTNQSLNYGTHSLNKSIENKRSTSNSRSKDKPLRMKDSTVIGHNSQTPNNAGVVNRYANSNRKSNIGRLGDNSVVSKQNNVQSALQHMVRK